MLETISNYPKLWRATIVFRIEVVLLAAQALYGLTKFCILMFNHRLWEEWTHAIHFWTFVAIVSFYSAIYVAQVLLAFVLYKGIQAKDFKKLAVWAMIQSVVCFFRVITFILEISDKKDVGTSAIIATFLLIIYRVVIIKIVYDAIKELRKFPMTVPFVNMRDGEDQV